jgi:hypothetical protein
VQRGQGSSSGRKWLVGVRAYVPTKHALFVPDLVGGIHVWMTEQGAVRKAHLPSLPSESLRAPSGVSPNHTQGQSFIPIS